jgi:glycine hydroxymethyltransferase
VTSGLRMGTPAVTTRGFGIDEVSKLANWIADIVDDLDNESQIAKVREQVLDICKRFPVYG